MFKSNSILMGCSAALLAFGCSLTMGDMTLTPQKTSGGEDGSFGGKSNQGGGTGTATTSAGGSGQPGASGNSAGGRASGGAANGAVANGAAANGGASNNAGTGNSTTSVGGLTGFGGTSLGGALNGGATANGGLTTLGGNVAAGFGATGVGGIAVAGGVSTGGVATGGAAPVPVVKSIVSGAYHNCALYDNGTVKCWGDNAYGQLGNNSIISSSSAVGVEGLGTAQVIAAGFQNTCALISDNTVKCWGNNSSGQLGNGDSAVASSSVPVPVVNLTNVTEIVVGMAHACAVVSGGKPYCWGSNTFGTLGMGATAPSQSYTPVAVVDAASATRMAANYYTCAIVSTGALECCGNNWAGQLGNGNKDDQLKPVLVDPNGRAVALAAGDGHTCALLNTQTVHCWGDNRFGELGNGDTAESLTPLAVAGLAGARMIASNWRFTCALVSAASSTSVKCWGLNAWGQLGDGTVSETGSSIPVTVKNVDSVTAVGVGFHHACALRSNGTVLCWGRNNYGQLGNGNKNDSLTAVAVTGL